MKKICFYSDIIGREIFNLNNPLLNRDNCLYCFFLLRKEFEKYGYYFSTQDDIPKESADIVLYLEMPNDLPRESDLHKSYLLLFETELIRPDNWNLLNHKKFNKIFTWRDDFVDNKRYFKTNFSQLIPDHIQTNLENKLKLCTLIAGNKSSSHSLELYSKRREAIRWFESNHSGDFDFYGMNWNKNVLTKNISLHYGMKYLANIIDSIFGYYPSYCGNIVTKNEILKTYKFCICYENARDIPGYITEKIFDCFFAGCVPIYWGANNIGDHIPTNTFIDKTRFSSYDKLYHYIKYMPAEEYSNYLENAVNFLKSDKIIPFSAEYFAKTVTNQIILDLKQT